MRPARAGDNRVPGIVEHLVYLGTATRVVVHLATGQTLQSLIQSDGRQLPWEQGTAVQVHLPEDAVRVLGPAGRPAAASAVDREDGATAGDGSGEQAVSGSTIEGSVQ